MRLKFVAPLLLLSVVAVVRAASPATTAAAQDPLTVGDSSVVAGSSSLAPFSLQNAFSLSWWIHYLVDFYDREPMHVIIELLSLVVIVYLVASPTYNPNERTLSEKVRKPSKVRANFASLLCLFAYPAAGLSVR